MASGIHTRVVASLVPAHLSERGLAGSASIVVPATSGGMCFAFRPTEAA